MTKVNGNNNVSAEYKIVNGKKVKKQEPSKNQKQVFNNKGQKTPQKPNDSAIKQEVYKKSGYQLKDTKDRNKIIQLKVNGKIRSYKTVGTLTTGGRILVQDEKGAYHVVSHTKDNKLIMLKDDYAKNKIFYESTSSEHKVKYGKKNYVITNAKRDRHGRMSAIDENGKRVVLSSDGKELKTGYVEAEDQKDNMNDYIAKQTKGKSKAEADKIRQQILSGNSSYSNKGVLRFKASNGEVWYYDTKRKTYVKYAEKEAQAIIKNLDKGATENWLLFRTGLGTDYELLKNTNAQIIDPEVLNKVNKHYSAEYGNKVDKNAQYGSGKYKTAYEAFLASEIGDDEVYQFNAALVKNNAITDQSRRNEILQTNLTKIKSNGLGVSGRANRLAAADAASTKEDYQTLQDAAEEELKKTNYKAPFKGSDALQTYIYGVNNGDVQEIDDFNTTLIDPKEDMIDRDEIVKIKAETGVLWAKKGKYDKAFEAQDGEIVDKMFALQDANGKASLNVKELKTKAKGFQGEYLMFAKPELFTEQELADKAVSMLTVALDQFDFIEKQNSLQSESVLHNLSHSRSDVVASAMSDNGTKNASKNAIEASISKAYTLIRNDKVLNLVKQKMGDKFNLLQKKEQAMFKTNTFANVTTKNDNVKSNLSAEEVARNKYVVSWLKSQLEDLERDKKMNEAKEGWKQTAVDAMRTSLRAGETRESLANKYDLIKSNMSRLEAAAEGKLVDKNGKPVSFEDAMKNLGETGIKALEKANQDYQSAQATGEFVVDMAVLALPLPKGFNAANTVIKMGNAFYKVISKSDKVCKVIKITQEAIKGSKIYEVATKVATTNPKLVENTRKVATIMNSSATGAMHMAGKTVALDASNIATSREGFTSDRISEMNKKTQSAAVFGGMGGAIGGTTAVASEFVSSAGAKYAVHGVGLVADLMGAAGLMTAESHGETNFWDNLRCVNPDGSFNFEQASMTAMMIFGHLHGMSAIKGKPMPKAEIQADGTVKYTLNNNELKLNKDGIYTDSETGRKFRLATNKNSKTELVELTKKEIYNSRQKTEVKDGMTLEDFRQELKNNDLRGDVYTKADGGKLVTVKHSRNKYELFEFDNNNNMISKKSVVGKSAINESYPEFANAESSGTMGSTSGYLGANMIKVKSNKSEKVENLQKTVNKDELTALCNELGITGTQKKSHFVGKINGANTVINEMKGNKTVNSYIVSRDAKGKAYIAEKVLYENGKATDNIEYVRDKKGNVIKKIHKKEDRTIETLFDSKGNVFKSDETVYSQGKIQKIIHKNAQGDVIGEFYPDKPQETSKPENNAIEKESPADSNHETNKPVESLPDDWEIPENNMTTFRRNKNAVTDIENINPEDISVSGNYTGYSHFSGPTEKSLGVNGDIRMFTSKGLAVAYDKAKNITVITTPVCDAFNRPGGIISIKVKGQVSEADGIALVKNLKKANFIPERMSTIESPQELGVIGRRIQQETAKFFNEKQTNSAHDTKKTNSASHTEQNKKSQTPVSNDQNPVIANEGEGIQIKQETEEKTPVTTSQKQRTGNTPEEAAAIHNSEVKTAGTTSVQQTKAQQLELERLQTLVQSNEGKAILADAMKDPNFGKPISERVPDEGFKMTEDGRLQIEVDGVVYTRRNKGDTFLVSNDGKILEDYYGQKPISPSATKPNFTRLYRDGDGTIFGIENQYGAIDYSRQSLAPEYYPAGKPNTSLNLSLGRTTENYIMTDNVGRVLYNTNPQLSAFSEYNSTKVRGRGHTKSDSNIVSDLNQAIQDVNLKNTTFSTKKGRQKAYEDVRTQIENAYNDNKLTGQDYDNLVANLNAKAEKEGGLIVRETRHQQYEAKRAEAYETNRDLLSDKIDRVATKSDYDNMVVEINEAFKSDKIDSNAASILNKTLDAKGELIEGVETLSQKKAKIEKQVSEIETAQRIEEVEANSQHRAELLDEYLAEFGENLPSEIGTKEYYDEALSTIDRGVKNGSIEPQKAEVLRTQAKEQLAKLESESSQPATEPPVIASEGEAIQIKQKTEGKTPVTNDKTPVNASESEAIQPKQKTEGKTEQTPVNANEGEAETKAPETDSARYSELVSESNQQVADKPVDEKSQVKIEQENNKEFSTSDIPVELSEMEEYVKNSNVVEFPENENTYTYSIKNDKTGKLMYVRFNNKNSKRSSITIVEANKQEQHIEFTKDGKNPTKVTYKDADGNIIKYAEYEYNENNQIIKGTERNADGSLKGSSEYEYGGNDKLVKLINKDADGKVIESRELKYNDAGKLTEQIEKDADGKITGVFDGDGNPLKFPTEETPVINGQKPAVGEEPQNAPKTEEKTADQSATGNSGIGEKEIPKTEPEDGVTSPFKITADKIVVNGKEQPIPTFEEAQNTLKYYGGKEYSIEAGDGKQLILRYDDNGNFIGSTELINKNGSALKDTYRNADGTIDHTIDYLYTEDGMQVDLHRDSNGKPTNINWSNKHITFDNEGKASYTINDKPGKPLEKPIEEIFKDSPELKPLLEKQGIELIEKKAEPTSHSERSEESLSKESLEKDIEALKQGDDISEYLGKLDEAKKQGVINDDEVYELTQKATEKVSEVEIFESENTPDGFPKIPSKPKQKTFEEIFGDKQAPKTADEATEHWAEFDAEGKAIHEINKPESVVESESAPAGEETPVGENSKTVDAKPSKISMFDKLFHRNKARLEKEVANGEEKIGDYKFNTVKDENGYVRTKTNNTGKIEGKEYFNAKGKKIKTETYYNGKVKESTEGNVTTEYYANGKVHTVKYPNHKTVEFVYDENGNLTAKYTKEISKAREFARSITAEENEFGEYEYETIKRRTNYKYNSDKHRFELLNDKKEVVTDKNGEPVGTATFDSETRHWVEEGQYSSDLAPKTTNVSRGEGRFRIKLPERNKVPKNLRDENGKLREGVTQNDKGYIESITKDEVTTTKKYDSKGTLVSETTEKLTTYYNKNGKVIYTEEKLPGDKGVKITEKTKDYDLEIIKKKGSLKIIHHTKNENGTAKGTEEFKYSEKNNVYENKGPEGTVLKSVEYDADKHSWTIRDGEGKKLDSQNNMKESHIKRNIGIGAGVLAVGGVALYGVSKLVKSDDDKEVKQSDNPAIAEQVAKTIAKQAANAKAETKVTLDGKEGTIAEDGTLTLDGKPYPKAEDGTYTIGDKKYKVEDGKLVEVVDTPDDNGETGGADGTDGTAEVKGTVDGKEYTIKDGTVTIDGHQFDPHSDGFYHIGNAKYTIGADGKLVKADETTQSGSDGSQAGSAGSATQTGSDGAQSGSAGSATQTGSDSAQAGSAGATSQQTGNTNTTGNNTHVTAPAQPADSSASTRTTGTTHNDTNVTTRHTNVPAEESRANSARPSGQSEESRRTDNTPVTDETEPTETQKQVAKTLQDKISSIFTQDDAQAFFAELDSAVKTGKITIKQYDELMNLLQIHAETLNDAIKIQNEQDAIPEPEYGLGGDPTTPQEPQPKEKQDITPVERMDLTESIRKAKTRDDIAKIQQKMRQYKVFPGRKNLRRAYKAKLRAIKHQDEPQKVEKYNDKFDKRMDKIKNSKVYENDKDQINRENFQKMNYFDDFIKRPKNFDDGSFNA